jgi:predicted transcriptional regulator
MTNKQATKKVMTLKTLTKVDELSDKLGISKATLYKRLRTGEWKTTEKALIKTI